MRTRVVKQYTLGVHREINKIKVSQIDIISNNSCHTGNKQHLNATIFVFPYADPCLFASNHKKYLHATKTVTLRSPKSHIKTLKVATNTVNLTGWLDFDDVGVTDMRLQITEEGKLEPTNAGCRCHAQYWACPSCSATGSGLDREEKSKQPVTRFVRVRGEIRWEKKVNISWTQSSVIGKGRSGELVIRQSVNQMRVWI